MPDEYYQCATCKKKTTVKENEDTPICCGKPMEKISGNICLQPNHAEHSRPMRDEEPCDDFRGVS